MIEIKEWIWEPVRKKATSKTITCPYCNVRVQAISSTRIVDVATGSIQYHIHKCPECFMPVIIGLDGKIIPQSQLLPFEDVRFLPENIEKLYNECRKCFLNECYHLEKNGYIGAQNKAWVDRIRTIGNKYVHELDEASEEDAKKVIVFIKQLLGNLYEMPQLAR